MKPNRTLLALPVVAALFATTFHASATTTLLLDNFGNGNAGTNPGTGNGFLLGPGNDTARARESGGTIRLREGGGAFSRAVSNDQLDFSAGTTTVTWSVSSTQLGNGSLTPGQNWLYFGLQENTTIAPNNTGRSILGRFNLTSTTGNHSFQVFLDDGIGANDEGTLASAQTNINNFDNINVTDGFELTAVFTSTGFIFTTVGLTDASPGPGANNEVNYSANWDSEYTYANMFSTGLRPSFMGAYNSSTLAGSNFNVTSLRVEQEAIPEPSQALLLFSGAIGMVLRRRRY